jgi:hypothetical protein
LILSEERKRLEDALSRIGRIKVAVLEQTTRRELRHSLRVGRFHIVHFMGHGVGFDPETGEGALLLDSPEDRALPLSATGFAELFEGIEAPLLVVLNACETAGTAERVDPVRSVAASLVVAGLPAVLAQRSAIQDEAALILAEELYRQIAQGDSIEAAVTEGRLALRSERPNTTAWAIPALFIRPVPGDLPLATETPIVQAALPPDEPAGGPPRFVQKENRETQGTPENAGRSDVSNSGHLSVSPYAQGAFRTISAAVTAATEGSTVEIQPGIYRETVTIRKPLRIVGAAAETTILETTDQPAIVVEEAACEISGLKIIRRDTKRLINPHDLENLEAETKKLGPSDGRIDDSDPVAVVVKSGGHLKLDFCVVTAVNGVGCGVENADLKLASCQIIGCGLIGIAVSVGATASIDKCTLLGNGMTAVNATKAKHVYISKSRMSQALAPLSFDKVDANIDHCEIDHGRLGMFLCDSNVIAHNCHIHDCEMTGVLCKGASTGLIAECELTAIALQAFKIEDSASIRLVSNQSTDTKLHVHVSGSATPSVASCSFSGGLTGVLVEENANAIVTSSSFKDCNCALQTSGQGGLSAEDCSIASIKATAIEFYGLRKATALLCRIEDCQIGVGCGEGTEVEIDGCSIRQCSMKAVVAASGSSVTINHSTLCNNEGGGAAHGATLRITDSSINGNKHNGIIARQSTLELSECRIEENELGVAVLEGSKLSYPAPSIVQDNQCQWLIDDGSTIEGVLAAQEADALNEALRNNRLDAADEIVIKEMRRVAGIECFDTQEKVNKIPEIFLHSIHQIWQRSGHGPIFRRDWITGGRKGVLKEGRFFGPTWLCKRFWDLYL